MSQFNCLCSPPPSLPPPSHHLSSPIWKVWQRWLRSALTLVYLQFPFHIIPLKSKGDCATLLQHHMLVKRTCKVLRGSYKGIHSMSSLCDISSLLSTLFSLATPAVLSSVPFTLDFNAFLPDNQTPLIYLLCPKMQWSLWPGLPPHTNLFNTAPTSMGTRNQPSPAVFSFKAFNPSDILSTREWFKMSIRHYHFIAESSVCLIHSLAHRRLNIHYDNIL